MKNAYAAAPVFYVNQFLPFIFGKRRSAMRLRSDFEICVSAISPPPIASRRKTE